MSERFIWIWTGTPNNEMEDLVLGIDLGTSGVKVGLLDIASLTVVHVAFREYDHSPEQDADELFKSTLDALKESVSTVEEKKQIRAIGLTGQMHGAVLYNEAGEIIHPLINWQERKYSNDLIIKKIKAIIGPMGSQDTGIEMASGLTGAILFGIQQNHPDLFARINKFVLPTDFIRGKLLGGLDHSTDQTNAFGTGLFNTRESRWQEQMIRELGLPLELFPKVHPATDISGTLHTDIADLLGFQKTIPIIVGGGDNQMSMLGGGLTSPASPVLINIGTAAQISMVTSDYIQVPGVDTRSFFNGTYAFVGASLAGGGSYQWLRDEIQGEKGVEITYSEMDELAAQVPPGAEGLVFCPGPSRSRPERAMGFYGNRAFESSIGHRTRAVMEGILLDLYELYRGIQSYNTNEIMIGTGKGLQKSKVWSQTAADIFQKPILITNFENALFGAAITAAIGVGVLEDREVGIRSIKYDQQILPRPNDIAQYQNGVINHWRSVLDFL